MKTLLTASMLLLASSSAWAATCASGTLASYQTAVSCTLDGLTFSNFTFTPSGAGATIPTSAGVTVTVIDNPTNPGLDFHAGFSAAFGTSADYEIGFTVTSTDGTAIIGDDSLGISGAVFNGTGATLSIIESVCEGGTFSGSICSSGVEQSPALSVPTINSNAQTNIGFGPNGTVGPLFSTLGVIKDIDMFGGTCPAQATNCNVAGVAFSDVTQQFSIHGSVPEPISIVLFGSFMLLIVPILRRRLS